MDIGWTEQDWSEIKETARSTYARTAEVSAALPSGPAPSDPYRVSIPRVFRPRPEPESLPLTLQTKLSMEPLYIGCDFYVAPNQLQDTDGIKQLAAAAAQNLAIAESYLLYTGFITDPPIPDVEPTPKDVLESVTSAMKKLGVYSISPECQTLGLARYKKDEDECAKGGSNHTDWNQGLIDALIDATDKLQSRGHTGPYGLFMPRQMWRVFQTDISRRRGGRAIQSVLGKDLVAVRVPIDLASPNPCQTTNQGNGPSVSQGLLASIGNRPFDLVRVEPLNVGVISYADGGVLLRVEQSLVLRIGDPTSLISIYVHQNGKTASSA